jgi:hypothetical protein
MADSAPSLISPRLPSGRLRPSWTGEVGICVSPRKFRVRGPLRESEPMSEQVERPPHPIPLHSPSKTGVNALKASGEREYSVVGREGRALPALPARIDAKRKISSNSKYLFALGRGFWQVTGSAVEPSAELLRHIFGLVFEPRVGLLIHSRRRTSHSAPATGSERILHACRRRDSTNKRRDSTHKR